MVYVDRPQWKWRGKMWCHLTADSLDELHVFAKRLGLKREWFQGYPKSLYPHYDTVFHEKAIQMGARLVDSRFLVAKSKALRQFDWPIEKWEALQILRSRAITADNRR